MNKDQIEFNRDSSLVRQAILSDIKDKWLNSISPSWDYNPGDSTEYLKWVSRKFGHNSALLQRFKTYAEDGIVFCFNESKDLYVPVLLFWIPDGGIKPTIPAELEMFYPYGFDKQLDSVWTTKDLRGLNLFRSYDNGFVISFLPISDDFNFERFVRKEIKYKYTSHMFGEKSKHISIEYFSGNRVIDYAMEEYKEFSKRYFKKWGYFLEEQLMTEEPLKDVLGGVWIRQELRIDGNLASIFYCIKTKEDLVISVVSVLDNQEFRTYSPYSVAMLDCIRYSYEKGLKCVRSGDITIGKKDKIGFREENVRSFNFTKEFVDSLPDECKSFLI